LVTILKGILSFQKEWNLQHTVGDKEMPSVGGSKMLSIAIECCLTGKMPLSKA
jgi:hypothetical protein